MNALTLGFELEVESTTLEYEAALEFAETIARAGLGPMLRDVKEDGSLNEGGAEIVSQPRTLAYLQRRRTKIDAMLLQLSRSDFRSWNGGNCGMHIHVGRVELTAAALVRLFDLVFKNKRHWQQLSGRRSYTWCPFDVDLNSLYQEIPEAKRLGSKWWSRERTAIHLSSHNTVEFRLWRGSLKSERFWHNIETTHAMASFALESDEPVSIEAYLEYVAAHPERYPALAGNTTFVGA